MGNFSFCHNVFNSISLHGFINRRFSYFCHDVPKVVICELVICGKGLKIKWNLCGILCSLRSISVALQHFLSQSTAYPNTSASVISEDSIRRSKQVFPQPYLSFDSTKPYVVGTQNNCHTETILLSTSTHNIGFECQIRFWYV